MVSRELFRVTSSKAVGELSYYSMLTYYLLSVPRKELMQQTIYLVPGKLGKWHRESACVLGLHWTQLGILTCGRKAIKKNNEKKKFETFEYKIKDHAVSILSHIQCNPQDFTLLLSQLYKDVSRMKNLKRVTLMKIHITHY